MAHLEPHRGNARETRMESRIGGWRPVLVVIPVKGVYYGWKMAFWKENNVPVQADE